MPISIRETIVTPDATGDIVQLHISDVAPDGEGATFRLQLLAKLPAYQTPRLAQMQREAMKMAQDTLMVLLQKLANDITHDGRAPLDPMKLERPGT